MKQLWRDLSAVFETMADRQARSLKICRGECLKAEAGKKQTWPRVRNPTQSDSIRLNPSKEYCFVRIRLQNQAVRPKAAQGERLKASILRVREFHANQALLGRNDGFRGVFRCVCLGGDVA